MSLWVLAILCWQTLAGALATSLTATQPDKVRWTSWADVIVEWDMPIPASPTHWIGAFLEPWNATYVAWKPISGHEVQDGKLYHHQRGTVSFSLLNSRHPYIFRLFSGDDVIATSNAVVPAGAAPNQGHLSYVPGSDDQMVISWTNDGTGQGAAWVRYGLEPDVLDSKAQAVADTYTSVDFTDCMHKPSIPLRTSFFANISSHELRCGHECYNDRTGPELFLDPGILYTATMSLKGLPSGVRVFYTFQNGNWRSQTHSFISPRRAGDMSNFTFLVTADMGIGGHTAETRGGATDNDPPKNGADSVVRAILRDKDTKHDEFILLNGDISYARGWPYIWERWFDLVQAITTAMPMMVSVGNHEVDTNETAFQLARGTSSGGECGVPVLKRFHHIEALDKMWYAFSHGSVKWIVLSTEHSIAKQKAWFTDEMGKVDRAATPWLLVAMHRPVFMSQKEDKLSRTLRAEWHDLFVRYQVDFVYTGHAHYYERLCVVENRFECSTQRDRPVYIVDGSAGAEFDPLSTPFSPLTMYKEFSNWGYSRFLVTRDTLTFRHYRTDNTVVDSITLPRIGQ